MTTTTSNREQTVLTYSQRLQLVELLVELSNRLDADGERLDRQMQERFPEGAVIDDSNADEYDAAADAMDEAFGQAAAAWDLSRVFDEARIVRLRGDVDQDPVTTVARALVAAWEAGADVGAVMVEGVAAAQRLVHTAAEGWLTSNRPGSWEGALLEQALDSSGWNQGDVPA